MLNAENIPQITNTKAQHAFSILPFWFYILNFQGFWMDELVVGNEFLAPFLLFFKQFRAPYAAIKNEKLSACSPNLVADINHLEQIQR